MENNKVSSLKSIAIYNILAIILQFATNITATEHAINASTAGIIILIIAAITIILNIVALVTSKKNNISVSGGIFGIIGGVVMILVGIIGWILLIISTVQLFKQKPSN